MLLAAMATVAVSATSLQAQKAPRPTPVLVGTPGAARPATTATPPSTSQPAPSARGKQLRPSPTLTRTPGSGQAGATAVEPQAAHTTAVAAAAFTAGLAIEPYSEESEEEPGVYARRFALQLDSAIATLVAVFRNTSGQPVAGAGAPTALSQRERDRWDRCRDLHWDLQSYVAAAHDLPGAFEEVPSVVRAASALDSALTAMQATAECDNVASMITAPDRWAPWGRQYETSAHRFYAEWYAQVRNAQEHDREFILALNAAGTGGARIPVPPAMPRTAPYAGGGVR